MASKVSNDIIIVLNTSVHEVRSNLKDMGIQVRMVTSNSKLIPEDDDQHIYGFTSSTALINSIDRLCTPPLLWETASVAHLVGLNHPHYYCDATRHIDGLIHFHKIDYDDLYKRLSRSFKRGPFIGVERAQPIQFGNDSEVSRALNAFLDTIPPISIEPTLVAYTEACKEDYSVFSLYLTANRLVTGANEKALKRLDDITADCKQIINAVKTSKDSKSRAFLLKLENDDKLNAQRFRFLFKYYGNRDLSKFLDDENNVSTVVSREFKSEGEE